MKSWKEDAFDAVTACIAPGSTGGLIRCCRGAVRQSITRGCRIGNEFLIKLVPFPRCPDNRPVTANIPTVEQGSFPRRGFKLGSPHVRTPADTTADLPVDFVWTFPHYYPPLRFVAAPCPPKFTYIGAEALCSQAPPLSSSPLPIFSFMFRTTPHPVVQFGHTKRYRLFTVNAITEYSLLMGPRWCSGFTTRLPEWRTGFDSWRGRYLIFERCSAGFLGDLLFHPPLHSGETKVHTANYSRARQRNGITSRHSVGRPLANQRLVTTEEMEDPRESPPTCSGIVPHDSRMLKSESDPAGNRTRARGWLISGLQTDAGAAEPCFTSARRPRRTPPAICAPLASTVKHRRSGFRSPGLHRVDNYSLFRRRDILEVQFLQDFRKVGSNRELTIQEVRFSCFRSRDSDIKSRLRHEYLGTPEFREKILRPVVVHNTSAQITFLDWMI
ncbi:hypothetical protein PR048_001417 [Dryococelus australis]|uniref:Uncharacterized protein n=1 Tax=Dryococelus australis TaxID=614101 RepID=A0ABQ9IHB2_9NEOP|nr:hypothetical protein PR048_001417 [Dryococelus australis]